MTTALGGAEFWERLANEPAKLAAEICLLDAADLDATLQKHAGLFAWVSATHEAARIAEERAKWEVTKARARAFVTIQGGTVGDRQAQVELLPEVQQSQEALFTAQEKRGALRAMADALEHRKDMLIQLSAKQRQERGLY